MTLLGYSLFICGRYPANYTAYLIELDAIVFLPGSNNQVFVIRIRAEPREIQGAPPIWRGEIEHLNTGRKAFFKDLEEIILFIRPVFMDTSPKLNWHVKRWIDRLKLALTGKKY